MFGPILTAAMCALPTEGREVPKSLPRLPVLARIEAPDYSEICRGAQLKEALAWRTFSWVEGPDDAKGQDRPDLYLECRTSENEITIRVRSARSRKFVLKLGVRRSEGDELALRVAAQKLAKNRRVISESLKAYLDGNAAMAQLGEKAYLGGNWEKAADYLEDALESDMPEAPVYYGLAYAYAQLGKPDHAYWYYMAFLRTSGIEPEEANREPLKLLENDAPKPRNRPTAPDLDASWRRFGEDERWDEAFLQLRNLIREAPWAEDAYGILADVYKTIDWDDLRPHWRRRGKLARKVNGDRKIHERVHRVMGWPIHP